MREGSVVDLSALSKLAASDLRLLWVNDWYDGPLEAVVELTGERYLMVLHGRDVPDFEVPTRWVLFRLSPEQWTEEERWHELFEKHVGHHWCFHHDAPVSESAASQDARRFYEPYAKRAPRTLTSDAAVGWVDEMPTH